MKTAALDSAFRPLYYFAPETNKGDRVACNAALFMASQRWTDSQPKAAKQFVGRAPARHMWPRRAVTNETLSDHGLRQCRTILDDDVAVYEASSASVLVSERRLHPQRSRVIVHGGDKAVVLLCMFCKLCYRRLCLSTLNYISDVQSQYRRPRLETPDS